MALNRGGWGEDVAVQQTWPYSACPNPLFAAMTAHPHPYRGVPYVLNLQLGDLRKMDNTWTRVDKNFTAPIVDGDLQLKLRDILDGEECPDPLSHANLLVIRTFFTRAVRGSGHCFHQSAYGDHTFTPRGWAEGGQSHNPNCFRGPPLTVYARHETDSRPFVHLGE